MRIAGVVEESIVDGEGIRFTVFAQGCKHHCPGCHNPETHPFDAGEEISVDELIKRIGDDPMRQGVTFSGGDPFEQAAEFAELARRLKERGYDIWCYTGYTLERLKQKKDAAVDELLSVIDVLVDGPYIEDLRDISLAFRGSRNQRIIRIKEPK